MLTAIRENSKGWIAGLVIVPIALTFALFGIGSYLEGPESIALAAVNGEDIDAYEYQNLFAERRRQLRRQFGASYSPELLKRFGVRRQVLDSLINQRVLLQYAADQNYRFSDEQLRRAIRDTETFQSDGVFNPEIYRETLASNRLTARGYEVLVRESRLLQQLQEALVSSAFVSPRELEQITRWQNQIRVADYAVIAANRFVDEIEIDEAAARAKYDDDPSQYRTEARIKIDYVELDVNVLADAMTPSEQDIDEMWQQTSGQYKTAEARRASHILFNVPASAAPEKKQEAREQAEKILAQAKAGADFADLAKQHSDDPGSSAKGGDLGVVARGQMVKPFEDAVFSMQVDEIRGPVETRFGWHIIKLTSLEPEKQKTLEEVRDEVTVVARKRQAENLYAEYGELFENLVFEQPDSLTAVADELGLEVKTSDWFTADAGTGIAENALIRGAAFGEEVIEDGLNSAVIELNFDQMAALRSNEYEPARNKEFDDVKAGIIEELKLDESKRRILELGEQLLGELQDGGDWEMLKTHELESQTLPETKRAVPAALRELGDAIYARQWRTGDATIYDGVSLSNGDYVIYALKEVRDAEADDDGAKDSVEQQLLARDGDQVYAELVEFLRGDADVFINEEQLDSGEFDGAL